MPKAGCCGRKPRAPSLRDAEADRAGIFTALASMKSNMAKDPLGQDLAVMFFQVMGL
jgi:hypothetical protein